MTGPLDHPWFFREVFPFSFLGLCCFSFVFVYKQRLIAKFVRSGRAGAIVSSLDVIGCPIKLHQGQKKNREALGPRIPSNFRSMAHFLSWMCLAFLISHSPISLIQHVSGKQDSFLSGEYSHLLWVRITV